MLETIKNLFSKPPVKRIVDNPEILRVFCSALNSLNIPTASLPELIVRTTDKDLAQLAHLSENIVKCKASDDIAEVYARSALRRYIKEILEWDELYKSLSVKE
jgi:hypothetical protein